MTLSHRNRLFIAEISASAVIFLGILAATIAARSYFPLITTHQRSVGLIQPIISGLFNPAVYAPFISMLAAAFYSLLVLILIFYFFEKTQAPEIVFFALFAFSLSVESFRCIVFYTNAFTLSPVYPIISARILFFGRYFGLFCLFAASIYAAGLNIQKQETVISIAMIVALSMAIAIPLDSFSWDTSFTMVYGYYSMFIMTEISIGIITALSFFIAAHSRGSREYLLIGISTLLILMGRNMLFNADTWAALPIGFFFLVAGTWFACSQIHRIYLWL